MTTPSPLLETDVAIIGAGPTGLFAVFECGMLKMKTVVIDALSEIGGQCVALYPEKPIYDIPAYPEVTGAALIAQLEAQAAPFSPQYLLGQQVISLQKTDDTFLLTTSKGERVQAKAVIIAAGAGAFGPNRPPLENLSLYEESGCVHYFVKRMADFKGKRVVIAGGGDSAVDWAIALADVAASVAVVHRRAKFRAAPESVAKLSSLAEAGKIELVVPYQLHGLEGEQGMLRNVMVSTLENQLRAVPADILLPFYGLSMDLGVIAEWGLGLERSHIAVNQATSETNTAGIYAVGDVATYPHKLKLILTGFAEAAHAAHSAYARVYPDTALHFEYSTSKGVPA